MNRTERFILGIVLLLLLIVVYGVLVYRSSTRQTQATAPDVTQAQAPPSEIKAELLQSAFIDRLRGLEVNGNLPVEATEGETYKGQERNPFEAE